MNNWKDYRLRGNDLSRYYWAALFLAAIGLTIVFWSLSGMAVWATPAQEARRQTIIGPITVEASRRTAAPGDPLIVIIRVTNIYAQDMRNVFVTIPIVDPLIVEQVTTTQGVVTVTLETTAGLIAPAQVPSQFSSGSSSKVRGLSAPLRSPGGGSIVTANLGTIAPGREAVINIKGLVRHDASPGTTVYLQSRLTYDGTTIDSNVATIYLPHTWLPTTGAPGIPWALLALLLFWVTFLSYVALVLRPALVNVEPFEKD